MRPRMLPWSTPPVAWDAGQRAAHRNSTSSTASATGTEPETSGADSLKTYGLVFGAYRSARTGEAVTPFV